MDILSILNFLLPIHVSPIKVEILPILFFIIIWSLFVWTVFHVYKKAKPENWENNWYGGNKGDKRKKLDAEHSSVMEISEAVATSSEKLADIMPGMILIIGLLGTFLGLGLALDKASSILTNANDISNMDASMSQLMGMLEGLGTKFKTSTWGLLAFILLKVILSKNGYEERRLRWSIEKVKSELDIVREQKVQEDRANNQKIIDCMQTLAMQFEKTVKINQDSNKEQLKQLSQFSQDTVSAIRFSHEDQSKLLNEAQNNQIEHIKLIKDQALSFEKILNNLSEKYDQMIKSIDLQHHENKSFFKDLVKQGKDTRDAMVGFIEKNELTVNKLGLAASGMSKAASDMGISATHLQDVISSFRTNMEDVVELMKEDLNATITGMNTSFSKNMAEMSNGLSAATKDISIAVNSLSDSVDKTMMDVTSTINTSMDIQKKSYATFIETSEHLNENVIGMTQLVERLSGDITGGLKAVSESNRNMISLAKKTDSILESIENIEVLAELKPTLDNLAKSLEIQKDVLQRLGNTPASSKLVNQKNKSSGKSNRSNNITKSLFGIKGDNGEG
ncbi:hypothetical protein [Acinetobacter junii]|uniref:MotA/TolQ/ExbB proton channel domain-containing protein n=1 Tax=Acinetobacter junii TaxID=40215 RepID=A0AAX1MKQ0_ACIJU|nr:hypothetical protein [Acinetobacter junii]QUY37615.1 hypothetical protein H2677_05405 [Acinetobacter junii]